MSASSNRRLDFAAPSRPPCKRHELAGIFLRQFLGDDYLIHGGSKSFDHEHVDSFQNLQLLLK